MNAAFEFKPAISSASGNCRDYLFNAAEAGGAQTQSFNLPSAALGITRVHPEQVAGKQRCFFTAGAGANFKYNVLIIVWIARRQQIFQAFFESRLAALKIRQFRPG